MPSSRAPPACVTAAAVVKCAANAEPLLAAVVNGDTKRSAMA